MIISDGLQSPTCSAACAHWTLVLSALASPSFDATLELNKYFPELENVATESLLLQVLICGSRGNAGEGLEEL